MEFWEAWHKFVEAYVDCDTKEVPTILSFCDFRGKRVLDAGVGPGRLALKIAPRCAELHAVDDDKSVLKELRRNIEALPLPNKVLPHLAKVENLPFKDGFFDIVYCAWSLQSLDDPERAVDELARATKPGGHLIIVIASGEGDETALRALWEENAVESREARIRALEKILSERGFKVAVKRAVLDFHFPPDTEYVYNVMSAITFGGAQLEEDIEKKIKHYLEARVRDDDLFLTQGAAFIGGLKSS